MASQDRMPFVEPPSPSHHVHFETTCVVIPEQPEQSGIHFEKHLIPLPIWRPKPDAPPPVITVRMPSLSRKHRRRESVERPLQPCLRHSHSVSCSNVHDETASTSTHSSSTSPPSAFSHKNLMGRRITVPGPATGSASLVPAADRIPLRECCPACLDAVMHGLSQDYHEHYTKGALRRRRASESSAPATGNSSGFLAKTVTVDEVDARRGRKHPNAPKCLPTMVLNTLCADDGDDEALLFPLLSPRRTPSSGTPTGTPPKSTGSRTPSPRPPPSPRGLAKALSETQAAASRQKPTPTQLVTSKPLKTTTPELTGRALLAQYPDVDALPSPSPSASRRVASENDSRTGSIRSASNSPTTSRRLGHSLFRTISPPSFTGF